MPFKNRIRLPLYIKTPQFPTEANRFRLANGSTKTLSVVIRKTFNLVTDYMPARMHQRLSIALNHDEVNIEGDRYVGGVAVDGEYKIEWPDFLDYPLGQAEVQIQVTPFAATNDNCQTCEEVSQLETVDDTIPDPLEEGQTVTINVFENDTICCFPATSEIVYFNPTYVDSATIDEETGEVEIILKTPLPSAELVTLATYRVTCPNGAYDEADIKGTVVGTEPTCEAAGEPVYENIEAGEDEITWTGSGDFEWELYTCDNLGTPIQTGTTSGNSVIFNDLAPGACYVFSIRKDCGGGSFSDWTSVEFTVPVPPEVTVCGKFLLNHTQWPDVPSDTVNYMDCNGVLQFTVVVNFKELCMLTDESNTPIYFESASGFTIYNYVEPC